MTGAQSSPLGAPMLRHACHLMPRRRWSRRSLHVAWTTATHFQRHIRWIDAVCPECCCTSRVRRSTVAERLKEIQLSTKRIKNEHKWTQ